MPEIEEKELKPGEYIRPQDNSFEESHGDLFPSCLEQILNKRHPLYESGNKIDLDRFDIQTVQDKKLLTEKHVERVNVDTTGQEKVIAFPMDARLYRKMRRVHRAAKKMKIDLQRSYERTGQQIFLKQGCYASAGQHNRAKKETKKLKTMLGCIMRDILRKYLKPERRLGKLSQTATHNK